MLLLLCYHTKLEASLLQTGGGDSRETESTWVLSLAIPKYSETGGLNQVFEKGRGKQCIIRKSKKSL